MRLIVCLDKSNGMSFNGRRQSRDRLVTEWICKIVGDSVLWVESSAALLFCDHGLKMKIFDDHMDEVKRDEFCFIENSDVSNFLDKVDKVYIFWWNRAYPADLYFPVERLVAEFIRTEQLEFEGFSHPKVALEVYSR